MALLLLVRPPVMMLTLTTELLTRMSALELRRSIARGRARLRLSALLTPTRARVRIPSDE
jgi:hypothetical protein